MTTYKEIKGDVVERVASDPTNPGEGDIWYNTTTGVLKGRQILGAWSSGGSMNTRKSGTTTGTNTAALNAFGYDYSGPDASTNKAEEYDGSSWTAVSNGSTPRYNTNGGGTQTTSLLVGGLQPGGGPGYAASSAVESWNGSAWTTENSLPSARWATATTGDTTALVLTGGYYDLSNNLSNTTMEYNGSTWTTGTNYPSVIARAGATGTASAAFYYGGAQNAPQSVIVTSTFDYDGSTWTANTNLPTAADSMGGRTGPSTAALMASGRVNTPGTPINTQTMEWDGTSFTILAQTQSLTRNGADQFQSGGGTTNAILAGTPTGSAEVTEEWTKAITNTEFTTS